MRLLVTSFYHYDGDSNGIEPQFYYLCKVPEMMGHTVDFFDFNYMMKSGVEPMRRLFLSMVRGGSYDAVFIATHRNEFDQETLAEAKKHSAIIAWNSDDEFKWDSYSRERVSWYTYMVTNSATVYRDQKAAHPNLLHAQWACTGFWDGLSTSKDIDFSFVGHAYGPRRDQIRHLKHSAGLQAFGRGTGRVPDPYSDQTGPKIALKRWFWRMTPKSLLPHDLVEHLSTISFDAVNHLWNRSRISFTPLDSSSGNVLQIKSRIFDQGLSGSLMLAHQAPTLNDYYEPEKEYVPFDSMEECADKARFYLRNESSRRKIVEAYAARTRSEHLWSHRIARVLRDAGLE
ncbi:MAG: glycosyltransferase [Verrucomicrobia bacterium]|nr:glycosyltransferase [Verrucomicrobiota bacterium]